MSAGRALLEQGVADDPAAEAGEDRQGREADRVEALGAGHRGSDRRIAEDADEVDGAEHLVHRRPVHDQHLPAPGSTRLQPTPLG